MNIIYEGFRDSWRTAHVTKLVNGKRAHLPVRLDLYNHSPDGFEYGYGGSGPAQLALALLADVLGDDDRAVRLHQPFKWRVIARLAQEDPWRLTRLEILGHVEALEAEDAPRPA